MDKKNPPRYYSIGKIAKELDLPAYTIRYWETEFKQLKPRKSRSGRRVYSREDLKLVRHIQDLLHKQGYTIKGAREALEGKQKAPAPAASPGTATMPSEKEIFLEDKVKELEEKLANQKKSAPKPEPVPVSSEPQGPTETELQLSARIQELEQKLKAQEKQVLEAKKTPVPAKPQGPSERETYLEKKLVSVKGELLELMQILSGQS